MDCEACTDRLVDLLYGELDEPDAESTRAHLAECESCAGALARLERGRELASFMVMEEPPSAVRNAVLAAARERGAAMRAPTKVPAAIEEPSAREPRRVDHDEEDGGGLWSSFLRWIGGFAMGPQVAMAMMLLLMVGIGLWYLPGMRSRGGPGDAQAILDPAPGDEVGPSQGPEPAAPLDLEADPRTGRIRPRDEDQEAAPPPRHAQRTESSGEAEAPAEVAPSEPPAEEIAIAEDEEAEAPPPDEQRRQPRERERAQLAVIDEPLPGPDTAMEMDIAPGQAALAEQQAAPPPPTQAQQGQAPAYAMGTQQERAMQATPRVAPMPSTMPSRAPMARAEAEGVEAPPSAGDSRHALAQAAHRQAASLAQRGQCRAAIPAYQRLLAENPTYAQAHVARLELADCYRTTGNLTQAQRLYEQSARDARVASRARRELLRLEAAERGMARTVETERTPDPPAAPARDEAAAEANE